jgi:hypothetical protein
MHKSIKIEPFAEFAKHGYGKPFLVVRRGSKTASVAWGEGTMWGIGRQHHFTSVIKSSTMNRELMDAWQRYRSILGGRAEGSFGDDSVGGYAVCVPLKLADTMHEVVRDHFMRALQTLSLS